MNMRFTYNEIAKFSHMLSDFVYFVIRRLYRDHCAQIAASLTFTSLLALVPFLVVAFSILRDFPVFPEVLNSFQSTIMQIFSPDVGEDVRQYLQHIVIKSNKLPVISFIVLIVTTVMMLYTVDDTLNRIWRVDYKRRTVVGFVTYILVVISGPLLLGASFAITTYIVSQSFSTAGTMKLNWLNSVPWLVTFLAFTSIYRWIPNLHVKWKYACTGGAVAMILFELAKWGFAQYIKLVPTYGLLYGALAAIPLTLLWIYISWLVVLVGAEVTRCLSVYKYDYKQTDITARRLLSYFFFDGGEGVSVDQVATWAYQSKARLKQIFQYLQDEGLIMQRESNQFTLTEKASSMTVRELSKAISQHLKLI